MHLEADPAPRAAALEQQQVAAVGVDVHEVGVQRADAQRALSHGASPPSSRRSRRSAGCARAGSGRRPCAAPSASSVGRVEAVEADDVVLGRALAALVDRLAHAVDRRRGRPRRARRPAGWRRRSRRPRACRAAAARSWSASKASSASASAAASTPPGARCARAQRRKRAAARRPAEQLDRLHRHEDQREAAAEVEVARVGARRSRRGSPRGALARARRAARGRGRARRPRGRGAARSSVDAAGARADVEHRAAVRRRPARATAAGPRRSRRTRGRARCTTAVGAGRAHAKLPPAAPRATSTSRSASIAV